MSTLLFRMILHTVKTEKIGATTSTTTRIICFTITTTTSYVGTFFCSPPPPAYYFGSRARTDKQKHEHINKSRWRCRVTYVKSPESENIFWIHLHHHHMHILNKFETTRIKPTQNRTKTTSLALSSSYHLPKTSCNDTDPGSGTIACTVDLDEPLLSVVHDFGCHLTPCNSTSSPCPVVPKNRLHLHRRHPCLSLVPAYRAHRLSRS